MRVIPRPPFRDLYVPRSPDHTAVCPSRSSPISAQLPYLSLGTMAPVAGFRSLMAPSPFSFRREQTQVLATSAQKWDARFSHPVPHTNDYYLKCCLGGVLSCGLTHLAVTPLDVAKCNMQVRVC